MPGKEGVSGMGEEMVVISFADCTVREANVYAESLAVAIKDVDMGVTVKRRRNTADTQDFGATLAIILGSASASAVASGVASWLARHSGVTIDISTEDGTVHAKNLNSRDASRIAEAMSKGR